MKGKERIFEEFVRIMDESPDSAEQSLARLGIPLRSLDELLLEEFGMTANEILAECRRKKRNAIGIGDNIY